ncbi:MAG: hypothetical protein EA359_04915 [Balneolaceae bacterium]|nr:MAG: hypothetical protein EA359_04915 [Balneolaceae bacterium]
MKFFAIFLFLLLTGIMCNRDPDQFTPEVHIEHVWNRSLPEIGIYSSPRAADLNGDGVKDLVFGTGKLEMMETHIGVVALSGATGETLWKLPAHDQVFGSATLLDITRDGTQDVIINGRAALLKAIEGRTGNIIWEFMPDASHSIAKERGYFNFYNAQLIPDQNGDGLPDLLVANGGDFTVQPFDPNRPAGKLMVIASATGEIIAEATVPDGKETYMSAVVAKLHPDDEDYSIIYGTGGETIGGNLYRTTLSDVMNEDLSGSILLATGINKGFIAPPVLVDLTNDGTLDIAVNSVDGRVIAIRGRDSSVLWEIVTENREAYASIAIGNFKDQNRIDLFTTFSIGVWPNLRDNEQLLINGMTGEILARETFGIFQTATPVVADFNKDGFDDVLLSLNIGYEQFDGTFIYEHFLVVYDLYNDIQYSINDLEPGANLASTPWVGDLNGNGKLDIVYSVLGDNRDIFAMNGFKMSRLRSTYGLDKRVMWGSYMGSSYNGIYRRR